ncbi:MAG: HU family DNA-binding protein [Hoylesella marshii]|uniref:DNA-binding protein n=1 Tax=Hoylesella marshii DSM 16973 = JCM 13450 TaxID=862515 RepID=E0NVY1_9BACT|nr:HU family DNA-binding protein [Hoylesella marshii]EFM00724.1 putative DNA-binding protein [Hoylesella marshii DSM 16973 = JCM 13450]
MAIFYNVVQRKNPSKPTDPMQWYIVLRRVEQTDEEDVAIEIADETTLNPHEARMSIEQMKKVLIRNLLNGHSVRLGSWGSFHLTISSKPSATEKEADASKVTKINIRFTPGKELKEAIAKAQLRNVKTMAEKNKKKKP